MGAKCTHCDGDGYRRIMRSSSVNHMAQEPAALPCQYCNLKSFGLTKEQEAEYLAELHAAHQGAGEHG